METKHDGLEIEEDMPFQQKTWVVERTGWALMVLIALASVVGLIDPGPLSRTHKGDPNRLEIEYERFIHLETRAQLHVRLAAGGPFTLQLPFPYIKKADISRITPQPLARVDESDILEAARRLRGLENMSQIKYAVLERSGGITIIPYAETDGSRAQPAASST